MQVFRKLSQYTIPSYLPSFLLYGRSNQVR
jgi:hypothetical protein